MIFSSFKSRRVLLLIAVGTLWVLGGCGGAGQQVFRPFYYRFTNSIVDVAAVDLMVDKTVEAVGLAFGASTAFIETTTENQFATYDVKDTANQEYIDSLSVDKSNDQSIHLFAVGVHNPTSVQEPRARILPVTINRNVPNGNARIYVVHAYVRAPGFQPPPIDFMRIGQILPAVTNFQFGTFNSFTLPPNTYTFEVRFASTNPTGVGGILFPTTTPVVIQAGKIYIFVIRGLEGGAGPLAPSLDIFEEPALIP